MFVIVHEEFIDISFRNNFRNVRIGLSVKETITTGIMNDTIYYKLLSKHLFQLDSS